MARLNNPREARPGALPMVTQVMPRQVFAVRVLHLSDAGEYQSSG